jgi:hypothetical protein
LLFDPPTSSFWLESSQRILQEAEWRLNVNREETAWVDPDPPTELSTQSGGQGE